MFLWFLGEEGGGRGGRMSLLMIWSMLTLGLFDSPPFYIPSASAGRPTHNTNQTSKQTTSAPSGRRGSRPPARPRARRGRASSTPSAWRSPGACRAPMSGSRFVWLL